MWERGSRESPFQRYVKIFRKKNQIPNTFFGSVSDPLFFLTDPDPTQKPKADPDPGVKGKDDLFFEFHVLDD